MIGGREEVKREAAGRVGAGVVPAYQSLLPVPCVLCNAQHKSYGNVERQMDAANLVRIMPKALGVDEASLRLVDRALADAGYREKGVGRRSPDVAREYPLLLLVGYASQGRLTSAARFLGDVVDHEALLDREGVREHPDFKQTFGAVQDPFTFRDALIRVTERLADHLIDRRNIAVEIDPDFYSTIYFGSTWPQGELAFSGERTLGPDYRPPVGRVTRINGYALSWVARTFFTPEIAEN